MTYRSKVCPAEPLSKDNLEHKLAAAWGRVWPKLGTMSAMAARMGLSSTKTISRATGMQNLPEAHTIFNSLLADPTALDEILAHYGLCICPCTSTVADDYQTLAGLCDVSASLADALKDGSHDHRKKLAVAEKLRPHMPALMALMDEANGYRERRS